MYNKVKPVSLESQSFKQLQELPIVDFPVEDNGSMFQTNLNVNVKQKVLYESANGKNIARMFIKVNAQSLGNITVHFKDVLLDNNSYCLVYTQDHQIVAGPIYQKSINNNQFTIMNIPASKLILEVIYKDKNDFTMKLNEVSFESLVNLKEVKKKEKEQNQLLSSHCDNLGVVEFHDNIQDLLIMSCGSQLYNYHEGCQWMGAQNIQMHDLEFLDKFNSVNDIGYSDYKASRSSCILMPRGSCEADTIFPDSLRFGRVNTTLINIPSNNCNDAFVIIASHTIDNSYMYDSIALANSVVRFNWHYKYGSPKHLFDIVCRNSPINFQLWRSTIDFSEVIDYEGVELFAYSPFNEYDFAIFKLKCKPFYKEYHLGWTEQTLFDKQPPKIEEFNIVPYDTTILHSELIENIKIIGSRGGFTPKLIIDNYIISGNVYYIVNDIELQDWETAQGQGFLFNGYSGSMVFDKNYLNNNIEIGYTILKNEGLNLNGYRSVTNHYHFRTFINSPILHPPDTISIAHYFSKNGFYSLFNNETKNFYRYDENGNIVSNLGSQQFYWYESMENKEKCPSPVVPEEPCDFDINDYVDIVESGDSICVTISSIPASKFPDPTNIPKGYRIYHNFGEQRTIKWESFQDGNDITFPIEFCLTKCEMLDMLSIGRDGIDMAIDFYDEDGNVYNNLGCDTASFSYDFPTFCEYFDVNIEKIDSSGECCTYEIELTIDYDLENLQDCDVNPNIIKLLDSLYFESSLEDERIKIQDTDNLVFDTLNGVITFEYTPCPDTIPSNTSFKFLVSNNGTVCEIDSIDFPYCDCDCPENIEDWVTITTEFEEPPCEEDQCKFEIKIDIPTLNGECYTLLKIDDESLQPIPPNGIISYEPPCIYRGQSKEIEFKLYTDPSDTIPCIITKSINCPLISNFDVCTPDCPEDDIWDEQDPIYKDIPGCDTDCKLKINYKTREANCYSETKYDIQVTSLEVFSDNPNNPNACVGCSISDKELNEIAIHQIIFHNEMNFPPNIYDCDTNWRVVQSSCWAKVFLPQYGTIENPTPSYIIHPCEDAGCCLVGIEVCNLDLWKDIRRLTGVQRDSIYCDSLWYLHYFNTDHQLDSSLCIDRCDEWLSDIDTNMYQGKNLFEIDEKFDNNLLFDYKIINNFKDCEIYLHLKQELELEVEVFDIIGQKVYYRRNYYRKGQNQIEFNSDVFNSGAYFINIKHQNNTILSDKFIIVR